MNLKDFYFDLPEHLIAQHPLHRRDQARLMVVNRKTGEIRLDIFRRLGAYLPPDSCLVVNDSKVVPARLITRRKTGAAVEIFLLRPLGDGYAYEVLLRPARRLKIGEKFLFCSGALIAEIISKENPTVRFNRKDIGTFLRRVGHIPLPPYIRREDTAEDRKYYQTVYAKNDGSVASATAGLHFTPSLLDRLRGSGHTTESVTLHINYGTFKPVEEQRIEDHVMHSEKFHIEPEVYARITQAKHDGRPIVAVGTTSCRALESAARAKELKGETDIFIYPGYQFQTIDALITNFHLPHSTLLMLVAAFAGHALMKQAYQVAVKEQYRFFSYGDAMLII
ncbi:MAG: tRNA preQ1(34) S-adenosylmethionine ribosyltransferase-isomerase QueA [Candidatus Omnitrophica bacterium]|nr:tRNA preQ1(34) S-adenosylmethionine ribosyltransferase-isomerase QueA [Candidatus Omnitrophota bacterium]